MAEYNGQAELRDRPVGELLHQLSELPVAVAGGFVAGFIAAKVTSRR
jgi:hypothetical protein